MAINTTDLKLFGNLPTNIDNNKLTKHLNYAVQQVQDVITTEVYTANATNLRLEEAVFCFAMISILPALNTLFVEGIPELNESGPGIRYFQPEQIRFLIQNYQDRANTAIAKLTTKQTKWSLI